MAKKTKLIVQWTLEHDGVKYEAGDPAPKLDDAALKLLIESGVIKETSEE